MMCPLSYDARGKLKKLEINAEMQENFLLQNVDHNYKSFACVSSSKCLLRKNALSDFSLKKRLQKTTSADVAEKVEVSELDDRAPVVKTPRTCRR